APSRRRRARHSSVTNYVMSTGIADVARRQPVGVVGSPQSTTRGGRVLFMSGAESTLRTPVSATAPLVRRRSCRAIVQFLQSAVLLLDAELRVVLANKTAAALFNVPAAQLNGLPVTVLVPGQHLDTWLTPSDAPRPRVMETTVDLIHSATRRVT